MIVNTGEHRTRFCSSIFVWRLVFATTMNELPMEKKRFCVFVCAGDEVETQGKRIWEAILFIVIGSLSMPRDIEKWLNHYPVNKQKKTHTNTHSIERLQNFNVMSIKMISIIDNTQHIRFVSLLDELPGIRCKQFLLSIIRLFRFFILHRQCVCVRICVCVCMFQCQTNAQIQ